MELGENTQEQEKRAQEVAEDVPERMPRGKCQRKEQKGDFLTVNVAGCLGVGNTEKAPLGFVTRSLEDLTASFPEAECEDEAK